MPGFPREQRYFALSKARPLLRPFVVGFLSGRTRIDRWENEPLLLCVCVFLVARANLQDKTQTASQDALFTSCCSFLCALFRFGLGSIMAPPRRRLKCLVLSVEGPLDNTTIEAAATAAAVSLSILHTLLRVKLKPDFSSYYIRGLGLSLSYLIPNNYFINFLYLVVYKSILFNTLSATLSPIILNQFIYRTCTGKVVLSVSIS